MDGETLIVCGCNDEISSTRGNVFGAGKGHAVENWGPSFARNTRRSDRGIGEGAAVMRRATTLVISILLVAGQSYAGGPLTVTGGSATTPGQAFVWNVTTPIRYTVDTGPLSVNPSGQTVISNSQALTRLQTMFQNWSSVPTAAIQFAYGGPISVPGIPGGDVKDDSGFQPGSGEL